MPLYLGTLCQSSPAPASTAAAAGQPQQQQPVVGVAPQRGSSSNARQFRFVRNLGTTVKAVFRALEAFVGVHLAGSHVQTRSAGAAGGPGAASPPPPHGVYACRDYCVCVLTLLLSSSPCCCPRNVPTALLTLTTLRRRCCRRRRRCRRRRGCCCCRCLIVCRCRSPCTDDPCATGCRRAIAAGSPRAALGTSPPLRRAELLTPACCVVPKTQPAELSEAHAGLGRAGGWVGRSIDGQMLGS